MNIYKYQNVVYLSICKTQEALDLVTSSLSYKDSSGTDLQIQAHVFGIQPHLCLSGNNDGLLEENAGKDY